MTNSTHRLLPTVCTQVILSSQIQFTTVFCFVENIIFKCDSCVKSKCDKNLTLILVKWQQSKLRWVFFSRFNWTVKLILYHCTKLTVSKYSLLEYSQDNGCVKQFNWRFLKRIQLCWVGFFFLKNLQMVANIYICTKS